MKHICIGLSLTLASCLSVNAWATETEEVEVIGDRHGGSEPIEIYIPTGTGGGGSGGGGNSGGGGGGSGGGGQGGGGGTISPGKDTKDPKDSCKP